MSCRRRPVRWPFANNPWFCSHYLISCWWKWFHVCTFISGRLRRSRMLTLLPCLFKDETRNLVQTLAEYSDVGTGSDISICWASNKFENVNTKSDTIKLAWGSDYIIDVHQVNITSWGVRTAPTNPRPQTPRTMFFNLRKLQTFGCRRFIAVWPPPHLWFRPRSRCRPATFLIFLKTMLMLLPVSKKKKIPTKSHSHLNSILKHLWRTW